MNKNPVVEIVDIQKALKAASNIQKAHLFNLIIYSPNEERTKILKKMLELVTEKFPCQIILIEKNEIPGADEIKVTVSDESLGNNNSPVVSEWIKIFVTESQMERVPFLIFPNIVADLPVYLIWGEDPTKTTPLLLALEPIATRLIFNSAFADHLQQFATQMVPFLKRIKTEVMDISWGRLCGWRDLLVQVFDTEEKIEILRRSKKIKIAYEYEKNQDALEAIYLQAFLANSLSWELTAQEILHGQRKALCYRFENRDINVILEPSEEKLGQAGAITLLEITVQDDSLISLSLLKESYKVLVHIASHESCELPCTFALPNLCRGFNFLKEIFYRIPNEHYDAILELIGKVDFEK